MGVFSRLFKNAFFRGDVRPNSVLLVETNGCHGEVISGYLPYYQQLGYNVDCLVHNRTCQEGPFARHDMSNVRVFHASNRGLGKYFASQNLLRYRHIIIMSSVKYHTDKRAVRLLYPELMRHKSVFFVHHNTPYIQQYYSDFAHPGNSIMLGRLPGATFANPHLFGAVNRKMPRNHPTEFIVVGGINARRKNHTKLINAIEMLDRDGLEFSVVVIGDGKIKGLPPSVARHIRVMGHLDFDKMYDCVEHADFYLPLLDADNPDHERYIWTQVTGSMQLVYGFACVPVVDKKFADFYDLNTKNAVLYSGNLYDAMQRAIYMSDVAFYRMRNTLIKTANAIADESFNNLKGILHV